MRSRLSPLAKFFSKEKKKFAASLLPLASHCSAVIWGGLGGLYEGPKIKFNIPNIYAKSFLVALEILIFSNSLNIPLTKTFSGSIKWANTFFISSCNMRALLYSPLYKRGEFTRRPRIFSSYWWFVYWFFVYLVNSMFKSHSLSSKFFFSLTKEIILWINNIDF